MATYTERYLAAALRGIPERQKTDVERELRSSIGDAVDDRVAAGEEPEKAEREVLEELGDPARLAAGMADRPTYLIGPGLFPAYRALLTLLLTIVVPLAGVVSAVVELAHGGQIGSILVAGFGTALTVAVNLFFWVTLIFAIGERYESMRDVTPTAANGRWTVDRLPSVPSTRISVGDTVEEVVPLVVGIVGLLVLRGLTWTDTTTGQAIPILAPALNDFWLPYLVAAFAALVGFRLVLYMLGRWTIAMAVAFTVLQLVFALPVVYLALSGMLINPQFAAALGYPQLSDGSGWPMILIAVGVVVVTGWEIFDAFRQALRAKAAADTADAT